MGNEPITVKRLVAECVTAGILTALLIIGTFVALASDAEASPIDYTLHERAKLPKLNFGFTRVEVPMPIGADLLAVEIDEERAVTIVYSANPDAPLIWRRIEFWTAPHPTVLPVERFIGISDGLTIWDAGEFSQPITMRSER